MRRVADRTERVWSAAVGRLRAMGARGWTLVSVLAIVLVVILVGVAIFILGHSEGEVVEYTVDDSRAFYIAEGGLERVRAWLAESQAEDPEAAIPVGIVFDQEPLGGGRYTVRIETVSSAGWQTSCRVLSTGEIDGVVRQVRSILLPETFARYQVFIERGGFTWFRSGERFEGPIHVNHMLQIDGDPWFGGPVTVGGEITMKAGSNPTFVQGYELNVPNIDLPPDSYPLDNILPRAGLVLPGLTGPDAYYWVDLDHFGHGQLGWCKWEKLGTDYVLSGWTQVDIASLGGAIFSYEPVRVQGVLDGQLTIGGADNIIVWDDLKYYGALANDEIPPNCDDVLGLITDGDVIIAYNPSTSHDCVIQAIMLSLEKNVAAEDYQHHPPRGELDIYGGIIADYAIHLASFDVDGNLLSGYVRNYHWDPRLIAMPPPFFPVTGRFSVYSWEEVVPPEV